MSPTDARNSQKYSSGESTRANPCTSIASDMEPDRTMVPGKEGYKPSNPVYEATKWPVVEYVDGHRILMGPIKFTSERITDGEAQATRLQIPLILAWALTVRTISQWLLLLAYLVQPLDS
ncbi:DNA helicase [Ceratobasidium sp. AG-Ba]|nr:DNA helicase [Ceratobasidium sp. AG-Ba]